MKSYQLSYITSLENSEDKIKQIQDKIISFVQEAGGTLNKSGEMIRKNTGYLVSLYFYLSPEKIVNLEKNLKEENRVLRYLILTKRLVKKATSLPNLRRQKTPKIKTKVELEEIDKKLTEILDKS